MYTLGLTGSSGAGKGYAAKIFWDYFGIPSLDTDQVARQVCEPGHLCLDELVRYFGTGILNNDGSLNRSGLFNIAFVSDEKITVLNRITHYHILAECKKWLATQHEQNLFAAIIDAPLLFESGFNYYCDYTIGVITEREIQLRRIMERDGITKEKAELRLSRQKDNQYFYNRCDFLIRNHEYNNVGLEIDLIIQQIKFV